MPSDADETSYLLQSPANAARLLGAVDELNLGQGRIEDLVEDAPEPELLP